MLLQSLWSPFLCHNLSKRYTLRPNKLQTNRLQTHASFTCHICLIFCVALYGEYWSPASLTHSVTIAYSKGSSLLSPPHQLLQLPLFSLLVPVTCSMLSYQPYQGLNLHNQVCCCLQYWLRLLLHIKIPHYGWPFRDNWLSVGVLHFMPRCCCCVGCDLLSCPVSSSGSH